MVYGANVATCCICGSFYITGDCIELDGTCDSVQCLKELSIRNSRVDEETKVMEKMSVICEDCGVYIVLWECPRCECRVCNSCRDMYEGQCFGCAPEFEKIKNKDWMQAAREQTKKKLEPMKKAIMEVSKERNKNE